MWRIFAVSPTGSPPAEPAATGAPVTEAKVGASTDFWESDELLTAPAEATELTEEPPLEASAEDVPPAAVATPSEAGFPVIEESAPLEGIQVEPAAPPEGPPRGRKARTPRGSGRSATRRAPSRRKPKEPTAE